MRYALLTNTAQAPQKSRPGDAAYDLYADQAAELWPGCRALISTGVVLEIPPYLCGLVLPRSGNAWRVGLTVLNAPGLIDPNYRGDVRVMLINHGSKTVHIEPGDRIAQLLLSPWFSGGGLDAVDAGSLSVTERAANGFGSSGR